MAGNKKKKKPAANPARGFATTSIASKPRPEVAEPEAKPSGVSKTAEGTLDAPPSTSKENAPPSANSSTGDAAAQQNNQEKPLSPEEFERQLDESELQLLVEKHSQKTKRDAQRQRTRLETDRRLLRGQADLVNAPKWLPPDMVEHILELIKAETRFAGSSLSSENVGSGKLPSEEDMIVRLWTLRQTMAAAGFPEPRVEAALKHILDIAPNVSSAFRDSIWGLDEALEWMARECPLEELPSYEFKGKPISRGNLFACDLPNLPMATMPLLTESIDTPTDTPNASRPGTPKPQPLTSNKNKANHRGNKSASPNKKLVATYDLDIEPEDLIPEYISARAKHLELSRSVKPKETDDETLLEIAKLEAKINKIQNDVLFDEFSAEQKWKSEKIVVEKQLAVAKKEAEAAAEEAKQKAEQPPDEDDEEDDDDEEEDDVNNEAKRIAAEILAQQDEDDDDIAGLFASLPQNEVDPNTGKTQTVINSADGTKLVLRDFGKWTGVSPKRVLEESCRSR